MLCPHCKKEMENPFGQYFYCKNECDLKLKKLPEIVSKVTEPIRAMGEASEATAESVRAMTTTLNKAYALRLGEIVKLTQEGSDEWSAIWGHDGKVDPNSYPYRKGDTGEVIKVETNLVTVQMYTNQGWWIRLLTEKTLIWFERF